MTSYDILLPALWAIAVGGFTWYCGRAASLITYVTLADGRRQTRMLPLTFRFLLPFAPNVTPLFSRAAFRNSEEKISARIVAAGFDGLLSARELLALQVLMPIVLGLVLCPLMGAVFSVLPGRIGEILRNQQAMYYLILLLFLYVQPRLWLRSAVTARHRSIERALPFVLDLMTLSVEAGLDFMSAIKRIIERRDVDALGEELIRVFRQVQLGKTRREALRDMSERSGQADIRSVVNALTQADELGVSIGYMLRIQAEQMRTRRFQRAEKAANEAPVKMLFPLVAFIFPCVFIVLLGPVMLELLRHGL